MRWIYVLSIVSLFFAGEPLIANDSKPTETIEEKNNFPEKRSEVENCLTSCYRVDPRNAGVIRSFLDPLINDEKYHPIIDAFIEKSKRINIDFTRNPSSKLSPYDGVLKASQWHTILFESPHVRILRGVVKCGECDPFHLHQWDRLMVVIQGAKFKTECFDGTVEIEDCPIGTYEMHAENIASAYTNIGNTLLEALVFEIKK